MQSARPIARVRQGSEGSGEIGADILMERWERRERKKQAERERMPKSGASVRLIGQILARRAAEAKAKAIGAVPPRRRKKQRR